MAARSRITGSEWRAGMAPEAFCRRTWQQNSRKHQSRHSGTRPFGADPESRDRVITAGFRVRSREERERPGMTGGFLAPDDQAAARHDDPAAVLLADGVDAAEAG